MRKGKNFGNNRYIWIRNDRTPTMNDGTNIWVRVYRFYRDGFREMTLGRTLWALILIKLFIMFFVLRLFFFPDFLGRFETERQKNDYVMEQLLNFKP